jgi:hypothetical protein
MRLPTKKDINLWLRKRALMTLSALVWRLDDWVHTQQAKLQDEIKFRSLRQSAPMPAEKAVRGLPRALRDASQPETFLQWEARRSGVAVITKKEARRRRYASAADFDRRFAS